MAWEAWPLADLTPAVDPQVIAARMAEVAHAWGFDDGTQPLPTAPRATGSTPTEPASVEQDVSTSGQTLGATAPADRGGDAVPPSAAETTSEAGTPSSVPLRSRPGSPRNVGLRTEEGIDPNAEAPPTWSSAIEWVDPGALRDHPLWRELAGPESPETEEELTDFVRDDHGVRVIVVTGNGCASGPDVIIDGHRHRNACVGARVKWVPVIRRTDLSTEAQEILIIKALLASQHVRRLPESRLAALEDRLYRIYARRRGTRTSVDANGCRIVGDTVARVAHEVREPRNAVADRRKIFGSSLSRPVLRVGVDQSKISRSVGARLIREAQTPEVAAVLEEATVRGWSQERLDQEPTVRSARDRIEEEVRKILGRPARPAHKDQEDVTVALEGIKRDGVLCAEGSLASRRIRVEVDGTRIQITWVRALAQ